MIKTLFQAVLYVIFLLPYAYAVDLKKQYHLPYSDAESKANQIVSITAGPTPGFDHYPLEEWPEFLDYIRQRPHTSPDMQLKYHQHFTKDFIYSWSKEEADEVEKSCGGRYIEGDLCGLNFVTLLCSQDGGGMYLYRTLEESESHAVVAIIWYSDWPRQEFSIEAMYDLKDLDMQEHVEEVLYRLVKRDGVWLLDGLMCRHNLNKPPHFHINFPFY